MIYFTAPIFTAFVLGKWIAMLGFSSKLRVIAYILAVVIIYAMSQSPAATIAAGVISLILWRAIDPEIGCQNILANKPYWGRCLFVATILVVIAAVFFLSELVFIIPGFILCLLGFIRARRKYANWESYTAPYRAERTQSALVAGIAKKIHAGGSSSLSSSASPPTSAPIPPSSNNPPTRKPLPGTCPKCNSNNIKKMHETESRSPYWCPGCGYNLTDNGYGPEY